MAFWVKRTSGARDQGKKHAACLVRDIWVPDRAGRWSLGTAEGVDCISGNSPIFKVQVDRLTPRWSMHDENQGHGSLRRVVSKGRCSRGQDWEPRKTPWLWHRCTKSLTRVVALGHIVCLRGLICYHFQLHLLDLHSVFNYHLNWPKVSSSLSALILSSCPLPCEVFKVFLCVTALLLLAAKQLFPFAAVTHSLHVARPAELGLWDPDFRNKRGRGSGWVMCWDLAVGDHTATLACCFANVGTGHKRNQMRDGWARWAFHHCYKNMCSDDSRSVSSSPE